MGWRKGHTVELEIENVAFGGRGVARVDDFVFFVRGAVPGDRVRARIVKKKRAYAEALMTDLLAPSPDRIQPPCPYHGYCGGCQWQHVRYARQLEYKKRHIEDACKRIGSIQDAVIHDVIASKKVFAYRNKMEFSFSDRRWYLPDEIPAPENNEAFALGLHVPDSYSKVLDVEACLLQCEIGNHILRVVKGYAKQSGIPAYGLKSHQGFWRYLTLRSSTHSGEWMVNLVTSEDREEWLAPLVESLCHRFSTIKTIVNNINSKKASIALGERERVLTGEGKIRDRIGPYDFQISANSFFQTNTPGAENLYRTVEAFAALKDSDIVVDLYSGTGTIPIFLSSKCRLIIGLEITPSAVSDAMRNCDLNGISNCQFIEGDIREQLNTLQIKPDVLIVDPPRAGMHKDVLSGVMGLAARRIVYVSCNPATMARDLGVLAENYDIVEIQPVDMFPHTYHIEAVVKLVRR